MCWKSGDKSGNKKVWQRVLYLIVYIKGGNRMNYFVLIGILIIVIGFSLKLDVLAVVLLAGITTGLAAKINIIEILKIIGEAFINNRLMSIFFISFPVIAMLERYGLKERSAKLISNLKNASAGKILSMYMIIRTIASALSIRIGGHIQFIRPLILPMSEAAAVSANNSEKLSEENVEKLKGLNAAVENYANFFAQDIFVGASGLLLIYGTLKESGYEVTLKGLAFYSIPIGIIAVVFAIIQFYIFDKKISKGGK